jgi:sporadic carbohydrate cluster protein (TIGR04323 family)
VSGNRQGYRGYVTSRRFGQFFIPVPIQSLALRDYCTRQGKVYVLPVNENDFPHSYLVLEGLIQNLDGYEGIVMCSIWMLPERAKRRRKIYDAVLRQGSSMHFVIEGLTIAAPADVERLEELIELNRLSAHPPNVASLA